MKKFFWIFLLMGFLVVSSIGCDEDYVRNLRIINDTEEDIIDRIYISLYVTEPRKISENALRDDHTIDPGESLVFKLAPYPEAIHIEIWSYKIDPLTGLPAVDGEDNIIYNESETYFNFENIVPGRDLVIEATYAVDTVPDPDEYEIELGGDGYQELIG